jgi:hypothetical protein
MKGDFADFAFDVKKRYVRVLMQTGTVQVDADWNEQINSAIKAGIPFCITFADDFGKELILKPQSIDAKNPLKIEFPDRISKCESFEAILEPGSRKLTLRLKRAKPKVDKPSH